jgi:hypothetical protein
MGLPDVPQAQLKGAWLPPDHSLTAKVGIRYSRTESWFCGNNLGHCEPGQRDRLNPLVERQSSRIVTSDLTVDLGLTQGIAVGAYVPYHDIRFDRGFGPPLESSGPGDASLTVRAGVSPGRWAASGGYSIELPIGPFTTNTEAIAIGRGTRNHVFLLEGGVSLWPRPGYVQLGVLYRLRETYTSREVSIDWGNELQGQLEGGWRIVGSSVLKLTVRGVKSQGRRDIGFPPPPEPEFRSFLEVVPGGLHQWSSGWVEAWISFPLAGRNMPADPYLGVSITARIITGRKDSHSRRFHMHSGGYPPKGRTMRVTRQPAERTRGKSVQRPSGATP